MKRIIHIITDLNNGGAEKMLYKLLKNSDKDKYYHEVISLIDEGIYGEKIKALNIKVHCLKINKSNLLISLLKARKICKSFDVVDTWLYHADFLGFIIAKILLNKKLIWNIRHCNLDKDANKLRTLKIVKANSFLSRYVNHLIFNSNKALDNHLRFGYKNKKLKVIPNGFELDIFRYSKNDREKIRELLNINSGEKVLITVGRWDIQKDYYTLIKSLNELKKRNPHFKMIMCGNKLDVTNEELTNLISRYGLKEKVLLLGPQNDIPALLSAADVYVSSSLGESFSNAIGEAMACELPCVVTDVGDSRIIVGDTGKVVEAKNYIELANSILSILNNECLMGRNEPARSRVIENYDIKAIIKVFEYVWNEN
jgi:glycosyltransferase involved in cell wall biosynthesis